ncbi:ATP-binding cassette domain-containing protein [Novosphingobium sp. Gsoil 351]|uniref:ATP-binding cassette domain-containing protein n=1 Tax=Novosphingobium sp. Gsoil 351 TaxID=2675225 RepID=UPI0012B4D620|nr:ATP-binding cassette domain-containing protein [Novosphingobium sp. Gsoil 351]QGN53705.1 ATP-binding cassette domain-containing protein [Novosphingobium sp. Gsoil 351]
MGPEIRFENVTRRFGSVTAVDAVDLTIAPGSFVALVGESGSGKSTLLRAINRLDEGAARAGRVFIGGDDTGAAPLTALRRRIGYVFQSIGLFPHMTAAANVAVGRRARGEDLSAAEIAALLDQVGLSTDFASRMPRELSGGQAQRVGIARALAIEPEILLLDEPFAALDPVTRDALGKTVRALHETRGLTSILVTHDMAEAMLLADRVIVLAAGGIVADATPADLASGRGGAVAEALVAVPREQARRIAELGE